jgi:hypothetical protein
VGDYVRRARLLDAASDWAFQAQADTSNEQNINRIAAKALTSIAMSLAAIAEKVCR